MVFRKRYPGFWLERKMKTAEWIKTGQTGKKGRGNWVIIFYESVSDFCPGGSPQASSIVAAG